MAADTWLRNVDRYCDARPPPRINLRNVYLADHGYIEGHHELIAMDFSECIRSPGAELSAKAAHIDCTKDEKIYGLFPEFRGELRLGEAQRVAHAIGEIERSQVAAIVAQVPAAWWCGRNLQQHVVDAVVERAQFVASTFVPRLHGMGMFQPTLAAVVQ